MCEKKKMGGNSFGMEKCQDREKPGKEQGGRMSSIIRKIVEEIRKGRDLDVHLPELGRRMAESYYQVALFDFAMKYTVAYEILSEELPEKELSGYVDRLRTEVERNLLAGFSGKVTERSVEEIDAMRQEIIRRMEVLTAYTDMLGNYEYILNRLEPKYDSSKAPLIRLEEAPEMAQRLYHYIFESDDNIAINEKIKEVLGQLPVRMTKQRFYDLVRGSMSAYLGGDASSLRLYDYMIRTGAMLYHPEGMGQYYNSLQETVDGLAALDFEHLNQTEFESARKKLETACAWIEELVDAYSIITEVLNDLYVLVLTVPYEEALSERTNSEKNGKRQGFAGKQEAERIICATCEAFAGVYSSKEDYLDAISEPLHGLEGRLEELAEQNGRLEAAVEEARVYIEGKEGGMRYGILRPLYDSLRQCSLLRSGSLFADLTVPPEEEPVTEEYLAEMTDRLIADFMEAFAGQSRTVRRAVMAETLSLLPVFFNGRQEVLAYLQNALESCSDVAEYNGSVGILYTIIGEYV